MPTTYTFDEAFQKKVIAMLLRDETFGQRVEGLVKPEFFDTDAHGWLANLYNEHFRKYRQMPSALIVTNEIRVARDKKIIKPDFVDDLKDVLKYVYAKPDISNRDYTVEAVAAFARERAIEGALLDSADLVDKGDYDTIRKIMSQALDTGSTDGLGSLDLFESIEDRLDYRLKKMAGTAIASGISTGHKELDDALYHKGWGRKELSCLMGGPKTGKSIGLLSFSINAAREGHNVLFVSLENSVEVTGDRADANISGVKMNELMTNPTKVKSALTSFRLKAGKLCIHEYPTNTMKCSDLRRLIRRYQSQGIIFDLIVVDYADIMAPEQRHSDKRFALEEVYAGLRAIAQEENVAVLTATQTNREGAKANTASKTDVAESIDKTRLVDILISINNDADEKARGEMRLFWAASRNSEDEIGFRCKTDRACMRFITKVIEKF